MTTSLTDTLAALAPDLFELFHGALETYLGAALGFWQEAGALGSQLAAAPAEQEPERVRDQLVHVLGGWERVVGAWRELQGAGEVAVAESRGEVGGTLKVHLDRLQREFEEQATGLQALVDLAGMLAGEGWRGPVVPEA